MKQQRTRNAKQITRFHNPGGPVFPLDKERKTNTMKATTRKPNRKRKTTRRRRRNTTASASVAAPRTQARFSNRGHHHKTRRRRRNGATASRLNNGSGSLTGIVIAGLGILGFDLVAQKFLGSQSAPIGAATKIGGGYLLAQNGRKLPLVGKHAELIGSGLMLIGAVDLLRIFAWPKIVGFLPAALLPAPPAAAVPSAGVAGLVSAGSRLYTAPGMGGLVSAPRASPMF